MKILTGVVQLIESPSGIFSLLCLAVMAVLTWHIPSLGAGPWITFFGIVPTVLSIIEHRETMATIVQPSPPIVVTPGPNLPDKGAV